MRLNLTGEGEPERIAAAAVTANFFDVLGVQPVRGRAFAVAVVGIYGLISYSVNQSTREIGLRMALGAQRGDVLRLVMGQVMRLVVIGTTVGFAAALLLTRTLSGLLYGITRRTR